MIDVLIFHKIVKYEIDTTKVNSVLDCDFCKHKVKYRSLFLLFLL